MYLKTVAAAYICCLSADRAARSKEIYLLHLSHILSRMFRQKNQGAALPRKCPSRNSTDIFSSAYGMNKYFLTESVEYKHYIGKNEIYAVKSVHNAAVSGKNFSVILDVVLTLQK